MNVLVPCRYWMATDSNQQTDGARRARRRPVKAGGRRLPPGRVLVFAHEPPERVSAVARRKRYGFAAFDFNER